MFLLKTVDFFGSLDILLRYQAFAMVTRLNPAMGMLSKPSSRADIAFALENNNKKTLLMGV